MQSRTQSLIFTFVVFMVALLAACDPMAPRPTPIVIVITDVPSRTPIASRTPTFTPALASPSPTASRTPIPSPSFTPMPCMNSGGQVLAVDRNPSEVVDENLRYRVYIPPCYNELQRRYPVVYLLHGQAARETQWETIGAITTLEQGMALGALPPMILVMPFWGTIGNTNTFPPDASYETVLLDELVPSIDRDFCTISNRENRAIGGISRGGFWAYSVGLRNPNLFGILGGHSAAFPTNLREVPAAFNPLELAANSSLLPSASLRLYLDNAAEDIAGEELQLFSNRLSARNIPHTYIINPVGDHSEEYWAAHVSEYLAFYGKDWERNVNALPDCALPSP
jgi:enterochelin esterase-like enzyme